jgi:hypothetical protein
VVSKVTGGVASIAFLFSVFKLMIKFASADCCIGSEPVVALRKSAYANLDAIMAGDVTVACA